VVRKVYDWYTAEGLSIAAIMRRLNAQGCADTQAALALGTLHGLGHAA